MKKLMLAPMIICICLFLGACFPYGIRNNINNQTTTYEDSYYDDGNDSYDNDYMDYYYTGTYMCYDESKYSPGYFPYLDLYSDGTFLFYVNLGDGMGSIWGTYGEYEEFIELYVEGRDFSGYDGDDVEIIPFWIIDDYTLRLHEKNFGLTYADSIFEK